MVQLLLKHRDHHTSFALLPPLLPGGKSSDSLFECGISSLSRSLSIVNAFMTMFIIYSYNVKSWGHPSSISWNASSSMACKSNPTTICSSCGLEGLLNSYSHASSKSSLSRGPLHTRNVGDFIRWYFIFAIEHWICPLHLGNKCFRLYNVAFTCSFLHKRWLRCCWRLMSSFVHVIWKMPTMRISLFSWLKFIQVDIGFIIPLA